MVRALLLVIALYTVVPRAAQAQDVLDDVFLFRNPIQDARVAPTGWFEGHIFHRTFETRSQSYAGAYFGLPFSPKFEGALGLDYFTVNPDFGDGPSGLTDLYVHGKYNFSYDRTRLSTGAFFTLPIGSEEIGEGDVDVGVFISARHPLNERTVLAGKVSLDQFSISEDDTDTSFRFHGGVIRLANERLAMLGEFLVTTAGVTTAELSGGLDYALTGVSRLRGSVGVGLNDNTSDLSFLISFVHSLGGPRE